MITLLYMATTLNGFIARSDDTTPWSQASWDAFGSKVAQVGNIVIGQRTYEIMKDNDLDEIGNPLTIVISTKDRVSDNETVIYVKTPQEALDVLNDKGFSEALVCGGSTIIELFAKLDLIDEIFLDIEPFIFPDGKPLFTKLTPELTLQLLEVNQTSDQTIQLHYSVIK